jgi:hypothetical protein
VRSPNSADILRLLLSTNLTDDSLIILAQREIKVKNFNTDGNSEFLTKIRNFKILKIHHRLYSKYPFQGVLKIHKFPYLFGIFPDNGYGGYLCFVTILIMLAYLIILSTHFFLSILSLRIKSPKCEEKIMYLYRGEILVHFM